MNETVKNYFDSHGTIDPDVAESVKWFEEFEAVRALKEPLWLECLDIYHCQSGTSRDNDTRSDIYIPLLHTSVETLVPHLVNSYLNNKKLFNLYGVEESDHQFAEANEEIIKHQIDNSNFKLQFLYLNKQMAILGTGIMLSHWNYNGDRDAPEHQFIDLFDFYPDPYANDIDDCRRVFMIKMVSLDELEAVGDYYDNIKKVKDFVEHDRKINPRGPGELKKAGKLDIAAKDIELLIEWKADGFKIIANRAILIKDKENPFDHEKIPFSRAVLIPVNESFYGIGIVEKSADLQYEYNTKRNQLLDNRNLVLHHMWLLRENALVDEGQLHMRTGGLVKIKHNTNSPLGEIIQPLPVADVTRGGDLECGMIKQDIQNTTGVDENIAGRFGFSEKTTATEFKAKMKQAANRIDFYFKLMADTTLKRIVQFHISLNQQFIKTPTLLRTLGPNNSASWRYLSPEEIKGNFDIVIDVDPSGATEEMQTQKYMAALNATMQLVEYARTTGRIIDPIPILKKLLEKFDIPEELCKQIVPEENDATAQFPPQTPEAPTPGIAGPSLSGPASLSEEGGY